MTKMQTDPADSYYALQARVRSICRACGRAPEEVTLVAVSKHATAQAALAIAQAGAGDLGENRVQDLLAKQAVFAQAACTVRWHMIGTLQRNKVRQIIGKTALVHSLDRTALAVELGKRSVARDVVTDVLLQFNLTGEASKHGYTAAEAQHALAACAAIPGIAIRGIMAMAPLVGGSDAAKRTFATARALFERLRTDGCVSRTRFCHLSMGMSGDYVEAIQEGATIIRVGSILFDPPTATSVQQP